MIVWLKPGEQVEVKFVLEGDPNNGNAKYAEQFCLVRHDVGGTTPTDRRMRVGDKNQGWAAMRHGHGGSGAPASKLSLTANEIYRRPR